MKSALRRLVAPSSSPVALVGSRPRLINQLPAKSDLETLMQSPSVMGTVYSIVSLYAESMATPEWKLYRKNPQDGRRRYAPHTDTGSDQRDEVLHHAALDLLNRPNPFYTRFSLFEADQQYMDLTGEWYWVLQYDPRADFPIAAWPVRPDRISPVPDPVKYIAGYVYTSPDGGEKIPLARNEIIGGRYPNPVDPMRGLGPVQSVLVDINAAQYSARWNMNFFLNSATPGGIVQMDGSLDDTEWDEFQNRWRETHQGTSAAHRVAILENGTQWVPNTVSQRDMDFATLRSQARDIVREAFRAPKVMLGVSDDVNRANAQTGMEMFAAWVIAPRLTRKRDVLNNMLLPLFGAAGADVEFDFENPVPVNRELDQAELTSKATAVQVLVAAGFKPADVLEVVGLPEMGLAPKPKVVAAPPAPAVTGAGGTPQPDQNDDMTNRVLRMLSNGHLPVPDARLR